MPGSIGPAPIKIWKVTHGNKTLVDSEVCLLPMLTPLTRALMVLHKQYQHGKYPYGGGLYEQPNLYIQAMQLLGE